MKYLNIILALFCSVLVVKSFVADAFTAKILGFEVNIWLYRINWTLVAIYCFYDFWKKKRAAKT